MKVTKRQMGLLASVLVCLSAAIAFYEARSAAPLNLPATAEEGLRVMASDRFGSLPDYRQDAYRQEVRRLMTGLTEAQRRAMFEKYHVDNEMRKGFQRLQFNPIQPMMEKYFKASPVDRTAVVDGVIDQMERFRGLMDRLRAGSRPAGSDAGGGGPAGGTSAQVGPDPRAVIREQIEQHIQQGNPQENARTMEFMKAVRQRRTQRGLPDF